ncbi:MAG: nickel-dependent lactate racemase [Atopobiaceae bacterium]|nr:nickel-dependent lactate racemase [Atopobiaceae bacterium]
MRYSVQIADRQEYFEIPARAAVDVMHAKAVTIASDEEELLRYSLDHPIGSSGLETLVSRDTRVCIITSDVTRPMPTARVLPSLVERLLDCGATEENITLAIALGSHRPQRPDELKAIMGDYYGRLRVVNGGSGRYVHVGKTTAGTPVDILAEALEADVRIGLGNVEYHYFAGYSGGAKALFPGMSTFEAIQANHSLMVNPEAHAGNINSPVRVDIEEACSRAGLDFIVNVVLDEQKRIVYCASGDYIAAHRDACHKLDELYGVPIRQQYDIVVASQGGSPKDLNLYQTQKALDNAKLAVRDGGTIILVGSCKEGLGQATFEKWLVESADPQEVVGRLAKRFVLGGHKAAAMAQVMLRARVLLVSDLPDSLVESCFMTPFKDVQSAVNAALSLEPSDVSLLVMPHAGSTLPLLREHES